jgi:FKBP-type peptidyl-prolyl cis-trans isomerase FkpA
MSLWIHSAEFRIHREALIRMGKVLLSVMLVLLSTPSFAADVAYTEDQKTLYALGLIVSRSLSVFQLAPSELGVVQRGITDAGTGKNPAVNLSDFEGKVQELAKTRRKIAGEKLASANREFLDKAARETGAVKTESGLVFLSRKEGAGTSPIASDTVKAHYRGTFPGGEEFDSSYKRGAPAEFRLDGVIKCWTEGLAKMKAGGKARLVCPPALAYGDSGAGDLILPGATLVFEVELLEIVKIVK